MTKAELFDILEAKYTYYNQPAFIPPDPIVIPHQFLRKQDIEISGFLSATIAWGNRKSIVGNARRLVQWMDNSPYDFLLCAKPQDFKPFLHFVHRTFNGDDCLFFLTALQRIYIKYQGLEPLFSELNEKGPAIAINGFREVFLSTDHLKRSEKHIANPLAGSAGKRINMFLRWMVRKDQHGVDFGIWHSIDQANLVCPLDIHSGRVARKLGLLHRRQNDWKATIELTEALKVFDPSDPVKYDFALFGMGVHGY
ncbi:MAG: TIGR02757 family protein [Bacteroidales bacterium]|nr:TIGR02757 family protein [Bacteroidales bacterium]